ncbi:MAG: hypothetical protein U0807_10510 [Candidatus Binatia bacterium]
MRHVAYSTGLDDTAENRARLAPLCSTVGVVLKKGRDPISTLRSYFARPEREPDQAMSRGPTLAEYLRESFLPYNRPPQVRKAQARDYVRHGKIIARLVGHVSLTDLTPAIIRGLQAELFARGRSVKYVRNIISGTLGGSSRSLLNGRERRLG